MQVNNAGASGVVVVEEDLKALNIDPTSWVTNYLVQFLFFLRKNENFYLLPPHP